MSNGIFGGLGDFFSGLTSSPFVGVFDAFQPNRENPFANVMGLDQLMGGSQPLAGMADMAAMDPQSRVLQTLSDPQAAAVALEDKRVKDEQAKLDSVLKASQLLTKTAQPRSAGRPATVAPMNMQNRAVQVSGPLAAARPAARQPLRGVL